MSKQDELTAGPFDSLENQAVTVRERDSMEQVRVPIDDIVATCGEKLGFLG